MRYTPCNNRRGICYIAYDPQEDTETIEGRERGLGQRELHRLRSARGY